MASSKLTQAKQQCTPHYVPWGITPTPIQRIKKVWGLGAQKQHCIDVTLIGDNPILMDMDAPEVMPAGSMLRVERAYPDVIYFSPCQRIAIR